MSPGSQLDEVRAEPGLGGWQVDHHLHGNHQRGNEPRMNSTRCCEDPDSKLDTLATDTMHLEQGHTRFSAAPKQ